jgi:hypothetical protein
MPQTKNWSLQGDYFETCNCETSCPCVWLQPPTEGDCKLLVAWHIDQGQLDGQSLDGLNVALACYAPGLMIDGGWQAALYVDERASDSQSDAIVQIFSGQQGGHPAVLMSFVGEVLGVKKVKIDYQGQGISRQCPGRDRKYCGHIRRAGHDQQSAVVRGDEPSIHCQPVQTVSLSGL